MANTGDKPPSDLPELIKDYYAQKRNPYDLINETEPQQVPDQALEGLSLEEKEEREKYSRNYLGLKRKPWKMPVHPSEEVTGGNITDRVAKESNDSTASSHKMHQDTGVNAAAAAHKANPGPVHAENIGEPASKEELKKRAEELNK